MWGPIVTPVGSPGPWHLGLKGRDKEASGEKVMRARKKDVKTQCGSHLITVKGVPQIARGKGEKTISLKTGEQMMCQGLYRL